MRSIPKAYVMMALLAAAFTSLLVFGISSDALSADSPLTHNSNRFGICKDSGGTEIPALSGTSQAECTATPGNTWTPSAKWSTIGGWGLPAKQYGEFVCETCHERGSANIKNIKMTITAPSGSFPGSTVNFQSTTGFGDDSDSHTTSTRVCEVCHSQTDYHRYNTTGQTVFNHNNNTDCIVCHKHNVGFKQLDCNACHGNPPTVDTAGVANGLASFNSKVTGSNSAGKHATHATTLGYSCENCHNGYVMPQESTARPGFWDISIGFSNYGSTTGSYTGWSSVSYNNTIGTGTRTCSTVYCHGSTLDGSNKTPTWTGSVTCGDCHKATAANPPSLGNHARHAGNGAGQLSLLCSDCHGTNGAGGQGHVSGKIEWSLNTGSNKFGANAKYWGSVSGAAENRAPSSSYQSCSSVYCHSSVQSTPPGGAVTYGTPQWGAGSVTCSTAACHGGDTVPNKITTGSHNKHVSSPYSFVCSTCHNNAGKNTSKHADRNVDVAFSGGGAYNGTPAPGDAYGNCSSVYCHSSVQADGGVGAGTTRTVTWNGVVICGDCHSVPPATGKHAKHADIGNYGIDCWACHNNAGINKGTGIPTAFHANGIVNMSIDATYGATATYSLGSTAPGDGYGTCATTYCHSAGTGGTAQSDGRPIAANTSPIWSGTAACDSCHAGTTTGPTYTGAIKANSHNGHVVTRGNKCVDCHSSTVNAANAIVDMTKHANRLYDVSGAMITSYTFAADGGTCANSCHFSSTPKWGGTVGCGDCHAVPPTTAGHPTHTSGLTSSTGVYGSTTDASTATDYGFNCGNCHPFTIANHGNGSVEVTVAQGGTGLRAKNDPSAAYTGTIGNRNGTCNGVYCHSDGNATPAFATTPAWNTTFAAVGGDACAKCHGNSPSSNAHAKHVVGIHYYNIYTGTVGLAQPGSWTSSSHGSASSTTINCNVCHSNTVTSSANDKGSVCSTASCHGTGGTTKGDAAIASKAFHVNGTADIAFAAMNIASRAQIRDDITTVAELNNNWTRNANSYKTGSTPYDTSADPLDVGSVWDGNLKTCSSIACHNGNQATWNSSPISCGSCHTSLTN